MSSNLVPWMIISWIHDGYYGNMVDEYHIIYTYLVPCWWYTEPESRDSYHAHMIPWHHVSLRRHIMCHVSLRRQGWAVCVCATQLAAHVSVSSTLQGHNLMSLAHDHIFGSESHTNGEIMSQWETCCWYTCTFGLGLRHKFPFTVTGLSYQDPISLFRFIKFIKTKFQRTPRLCRV